MNHRSAIFGLLLVMATFAHAQAVPVPFSENEIETGLRGGVTPKRMTALVEKNGVAFKLTPAAERRLRASGADDLLIGTIRKRPTLAGVVPGQLVHSVPPVYPQMAKVARVQGTIVLEATIDEKGDVTDVRVISGHPMLQQAAIDAVKQWKYTPFRLQGRPVAVTTTVTVNFVLQGG